MLFKKAFQSIKSFLGISKSTENTITKQPNPYNYNDIQNALDKLKINQQEDFTDLLNVICYGDYGPNNEENLSNTIDTLYQIINDIDQNTQIEPEDTNQYNEQKASDNSITCFDDKEKIKCILNAIFRLECNQILFQKEKVLSKFVDLDSVCLRIDTNDEPDIVNAIDQLLLILESNESKYLQSFQKSNEYLAQKKFEIAKEYLKFNININDFEIYDVGNICFFQDMLTLIQLTKIFMNFRKFSIMLSRIDVDQFACQTLHSISKTQFDEGDVDELTNSIERLREILENNEVRIEQINQKEKEYNEQNNNKMVNHYQSIIRNISKCNDLIEQFISEIEKKLDQIHQKK